jgi:DNA-directed RNA polymerase subunit N (RpoN/RPB10)
MIIPVRCTCGKYLSDKYRYYERELLKKKLANKMDADQELIIDFNVEEIKKTIAGEIMDELGLIRQCCRKTMLTNIDLINEI